MVDVQRWRSSCVPAGSLTGGLPSSPSIPPQPLSLSSSSFSSSSSVSSGFSTNKRQDADDLIDSTLHLLNKFWLPIDPAVRAGSTLFSDDSVPLRTFVNEILRRSRSSCATLRAARWYLERASSLLDCDTPRHAMLACPRRIFLSSLILANKFLHDRVYSNRAWGKVSGLQVFEISLGEAALGDLLGWSLWVGREPSSDATAASTLARSEAEAKLDALAPPLIALSEPVPRKPRSRSKRHFQSPSLSVQAPAAVIEPVQSLVVSPSASVSSTSSSSSFAQRGVQLSVGSSFTQDTRSVFSSEEDSSASSASDSSSEDGAPETDSDSEGGGDGGDVGRASADGEVRKRIRLEWGAVDQENVSSGVDEELARWVILA